MSQVTMQTKKIFLLIINLLVDKLYVICMLIMYKYKLRLIIIIIIIYKDYQKKLEGNMVDMNLIHKYFL